MHWIAPSEKDAANETLEKRLRAAADQLRANSGLTSQQYSLPVLGLIFPRFAEVRFNARYAALTGQPSPFLSQRERRAQMQTVSALEEIFGRDTSARIWR
jgi:hypothetical protein